MTCLNPMFAKRSAVPNANGKYELSNFVSYRDLSGKSLEIAKAQNMIMWTAIEIAILAAT